MASSETLLTLQKEKPHLFDAETWGYGPVFEVLVRLEHSVWDLASPQACELLRMLSIDGPFDGPSKIMAGSSTTDWRRAEGSVGIWQLASNRIVGVKLLTDKSSPTDFLLAVPPMHVEKEFGRYPWKLQEDWISPLVIELHRLVIDKLRDLHRHFHLVAALIQDEAWTFSLKKADKGILILKEIGLTAGLPGKEVDSLYQIGLSAQDD